LLAKLPMKPLVNRTRRSFTNILKRTLLPSGVVIGGGNSTETGRHKFRQVDAVLTQQIWHWPEELEATHANSRRLEASSQYERSLCSLSYSQDKIHWNGQSCYERPPKENTEDMKARSNGLAKSSKLPTQQIVVRIEVEDTGHGIRRDDMYKLFNKLTVDFLKSIRPSYSE